MADPFTAPVPVEMLQEGPATAVPVGPAASANCGKKRKRLGTPETVRPDPPIASRRTGGSKHVSLNVCRLFQMLLANYEGVRSTYMTMWKVGSLGSHNPPDFRGGLLPRRHISGIFGEFFPEWLTPRHFFLQHRILRFLDSCEQGISHTHRFQVQRHL